MELSGKAIDLLVPLFMQYVKTHGLVLSVYFFHSHLP